MGTPANETQSQANANSVAHTVALVTPRLSVVTSTELRSGNCKQKDYIAGRVAAGISKALARAEFANALTVKATELRDEAASAVQSRGVKRLGVCKKTGEVVRVYLNRANSKEHKANELAIALGQMAKLRAEMDALRLQIAANVTPQA